MFSDEIKESIALQVIKTLKKQFDKFPDDFSESRNAPFHKAFLNAFTTRLDGKVESQEILISLSSWMHGLNTSLGQSFFENVARILCIGAKKTFKNQKIYAKQARIISEIMTDLKNSSHFPNLVREEDLLNANSNGKMIETSDFTVDCLNITSDKVIAVELKSVRPNSGEMRGEKQKILTAKAVLNNLYPTKEVKYYFGFPFDPLSDISTGFDKERFLNHLIEGSKFLNKDEFLLSEELWCFLSGDENSMQQILDIIISIATPDFMKKFEFLNTNDSIITNNLRYKEIVEKWFLYGELEIANNIEVLKRKAETVIKANKYINQNPFDDDGLYNDNRAKYLNSYL
jgi:hypothetical protein